MVISFRHTREASIYFHEPLLPYEVLLICFGHKYAQVIYFNSDISSVERKIVRLKFARKKLSFKARFNRHRSKMRSVYRIKIMAVHLRARRSSVWLQLFVKSPESCLAQTNEHKQSSAENMKKVIVVCIVFMA